MYSLILTDCVYSEFRPLFCCYGPPANTLNVYIRMMEAVMEEERRRDSWAMYG